MFFNEQIFNYFSLPKDIKMHCENFTVQFFCVKFCHNFLKLLIFFVYVIKNTILSAQFETIWNIQIGILIFQRTCNKIH